MNWSIVSFPLLAAFLLGYLLGSIPFGLILTRLAGLGDIRKVAAVITRGHLIYPHEVDQALGIVPFVKDAPQLQVRAPVSSNIAGSNEGVLQKVLGTARH